MYLYTTPLFDEQTAQYGLEHSVSKLREKLKTYHVRHLMDPVGPYYKRREGKLRVIADVQRVENEEVVCLLRVIERKSGEYDRFLDDPAKFGEKLLQPLLDVGALHSFIKNAKVADPIGRDPLPDALRLWFEPPEWVEMETEDLLISESREWVRRFRRQEVQRFWQTFHALLEGVVNRNIEHDSVAGLQGLELAGNAGRFILYARTELREDTNDVPRKAIFLIAPFTSRPSLEEIRELAIGTGIFEQSEDSSRKIVIITAEKLAQCARRSYPGYLIADEDSWFAIENEVEANLALSAEEELILKSVSSPATGHPSLPIFINGRAGSGKSTMLLYLFADYCYRKLRHGLSGNPLFLTYNERLLEVAREAVTKLLRSHYRFVHDRETADLAKPGIADFFQPFQKFLIRLLPPNEQTRFSAENYISFHRFKSLYSERRRVRQGTGEVHRELPAQDRPLILKLPEADNWSPEVCWYLIRTFVKGYLLDGLMSVDDYREEVPRRERIIPEDMFEEIYNTIWKRWYQPLTSEKACWDDQDLVRRVLELGCVPSDFTAVFCDEAQDFTRLELRLVMQLSIFSRFDLGYAPIRSLPFAFAGDPLQTLNPTGFSWASVRATFYEEVISVLDPSHNWKLDMNFKSLTFNYRSTPPIVRVANLIQLWRHSLFRLQDVEPQRSWQMEESPDPLKFVLSRNLNPDDLKRVIENTIIIVPCEEGEEISFIRTDPVLSHIFRDIELEEPPKNVLSAIAAKGLEFKRVILYNFGDKCDKAVWTLLNREDDRRDIEREYFFNKLYVAATRAMERLFIVDSEEGDQRLWRRSSSESDAEPFLKRLTNRELWQENVQFITYGTLDDIEWMREEDPLFNAQQFESKGLNLQNPKLLRRAKQFYRAIGHDSNALLCEAEALKLEGNYAEASAVFQSLGRIDQAGKCLWRGMLWKDLAEFSRAHPESMKQEVNVAGFMIADKGDPNILCKFTAFIRNTIDDKDAAINPSTQWRAAVAEYAARLANLDEKSLTLDDWQRAGSALEMLSEFGYSAALTAAGHCFFRGNSFHRAAKCWEKCDSRPREYFLAKARIDTQNDLKWLDRAEAYQEQIRLWLEAGGLAAVSDKPWPKYIETALERTNQRHLLVTEWNKLASSDTAIAPHWLRMIGPALEKDGRYWDAAQVYLQLDRAEHVRACLEKMSVNRMRRAKPNAIRLDWPEVKRLAEYFLRRRDYLSTIDVVSKYFDRVGGSSDEKLKICCAILNAVVESDETPDRLGPFHRDQYRLLTRILLSYPESEWRQYSSARRVGKALEMCGDYDEVFTFYENMLNGRNESMSLFAKRRWIRNKQKQEEESKKAGNEFFAAQVQSEIERRARSWNILLEDRIPFYPSLDKEERDDRKPERIVGLPAGTTAEEVVEGVYRFRLAQIEVTVYAAKSIVLFHDLNNLDVIKVHAASGEIDDPTGTVSQQRGNNEIRFESELGFGGRVLLDCEPKRLEVRVKGIEDTVSISI